MDFYPPLNANLKKGRIMNLARHRAFWLASALAALLAVGPAAAQEAQDEPAAKPFDPAQEEAIRQLVREYLLAHPEVVIEAAQAYRAQQEQIQEQRVRETLVSQREALERDPDAPVIGNPDGDVVVVEFFDYRCPYCLRVAPSLRETIKDDGNIRLVMKELPILGPDSLTASRMALAAVKQDGYEDLHFAFMTAPGKLNEEMAFKIAEDLGLDLDQLRRDMQAPEIDEMLQRNLALAQALQINGTPGFVIGDQVVRGALDMETLQHLVEVTRAKSS